MQEGIGSRVLRKIDSRPANSSAGSDFEEALRRSREGIYRRDFDAVVGWRFSVPSPSGPRRFI
jgi:hypothetical protein